ncbi:MAG: histidine phosphatase family protein [Dokdonella sp.]
MTSQASSSAPLADSWSIPANSFIFVRHGQTDWNARQLYQGQKDIPLNAAGQAQAALCGEALRALVSVRSICTSPLARARETADIIARLNPAKIEMIDGLAECGFGELEGLPKDDPDFDVRWRAGETSRQVEPYAAFCERVMLGLATALNRKGPVLIVAHRAVFWPLSNALCGEVAEDLPNCRPVTLLPPTTPDLHWRMRMSAGCLHPPESRTT